MNFVRLALLSGAALGLIALSSPPAQAAPPPPPKKPEEKPPAEEDLSNVIKFERTPEDEGQGSGSSIRAATATQEPEVASGTA